MLLSEKNRKPILLFLTTPVILFIYFFQWRTKVAYGDDLYLFQSYDNIHSLFDMFSIPVYYGKLRPVQGLGITTLVSLFHKKVFAYYIFNILILSLNTIVFALILNWFLKSHFLSFLASLTLGLSRFCYYDVTQLLNGGLLEGLAMSFCLLSVYFILKSIIQVEYPEAKRKRDILWSLAFANLSVYTHERYIVLFLFIVFMLLIVPSLRKLNSGNRIVLIGAAVLSILLNIVAKKALFNLPFFVGTGGITIEINFSTITTFFFDCLLSLIGINSGPRFLTGASFSDLPVLDQSLIIIGAATVLTVLALYIDRAIRSYRNKGNRQADAFPVFLGLSALLLLFLIPAIITIRVEPRWLQGPFAILVLLLVIAQKDLKFKNEKTGSYLFSLLVLLFLWTDFTYFKNGIPNLYMSNSTKKATMFKEAMENDVIKPATEKLYIWNISGNATSGDTIKWTLAEGYYFNFYAGKDKQLIFADSVYPGGYSFTASSFANFDKSKDQVVFIGNDIVDITEEYFKDSLKSFMPERASQLWKVTLKANTVANNKTN